MFANPLPLPAIRSSTKAARWGRFIDFIRLVHHQIRQALGSKGIAWVAAAIAIGLVCSVAAIVEVASSLGPTAVLRTRDEAARMIALNEALDRGYRALTQTISVMGAGSSSPKEGLLPIRSTWAQFTGAMETSCAGAYSSLELALRMAQLCDPFPSLRDRVNVELQSLNPPTRLLDPSIAHDLTVLGENIGETTQLVDRLTTAVFELTADRYRFAIAMLAFSTAGLLATSLVFIFLSGRGSVLHFKQWQRAAGAATQASAARDLVNETIEALPAGVVLYDAEDRLVLFNSEAASTAPVLRQPGAIGMAHTALANAAGRAREAAGLGSSDNWTAESIARFKSKGNRGLNHLPDGRWFETYEKLTPTGRTVGLRVDVTALKTRQLELERAQAEYHALVDSLSDVVFAIDIKGFFTFVSAASADLFGKPASRLIGTSFRDHIEPADLDHVVTATQNLAQSSSPAVEQLQFRLKSADERSRHVEVRIRKTLAGNIQNAVISGVMRDVEERVQLTRRLDGEMTRLRSIVESSGALIVLIDRRFDVVMVNSEFTAVTGIRDTEAIGRPYKDVIHCPLDPIVLTRWLSGPIEQDRTESLHFSCKLEDTAGRQRIFNMTATAVTDSERNVRNIVLLGVDDTARRQTQSQLFDAERMKGLGEIAATVAHELNQPLQVITFTVEGMIEEIDEAAGRSITTDGAVAQEKLNRILAQVDRASRLIKELRSHARSTSTEEPGTFSLETAVRGAVDLTEYLVNQNGATVVVAVSGGLPPVLGHLNRLEQVLINLINNARDALGEMQASNRSRLITISAKLAPHDGLNFLLLAVEDTGPGIAEHILQRMFEPFLTTKPRGKGTGLGLPLCKRIIEEMGGTIAAFNLPGNGARFEITLPAAPQVA